MSEQTVDLGVTNKQLVRAFIWVIGSMIIGVAIIAFATANPEFYLMNFLIGIAICLAAAFAGVQEWRALPGAVLVFGDGSLTLTTRGGKAFTFDYDAIESLEVANLAEGLAARSKRSALRSDWWLTVHPVEAHWDDPGMNVPFAIGITAQRVDQLNQCAKARGVRLDS